MWRHAVALWRELAARLERRGQAGGARPERRQGIRFPSAARTTCRLAETADTEAVPAAVHNISFGGINLLVPRPLAGGALLHIDLPGQGACRLLACVAHVSSAGASAWSVGCSFIRELRDEEFRALL